MTCISKVRSTIIIIITVSNPSEAKTIAFTFQVDQFIVYRLPYMSKNYDVRCPSSNLCSTTHDAFIPIR